MSVLAEFIGGYDSLGSEQVRINNKGVRQVRRGGRWMKACRHRTGCDKSAEGSTDYCVEHGGGKRCLRTGCDKSAQGSTDYCIKHGGGRRCESAACMAYADASLRGYARYAAPSDKLHGTVFIRRGTPLCYACLGSAYSDCVTLKVRQEHLILAELQRLLPGLEDWFLEWDCPLTGGCSLKRPDMLWEMPRFYLQFEVDEGGQRHEDSRERLDEIHSAMGGRLPGLVVRVNAEGMLRKKQHHDGEIKYTATPRFATVMEDVAAFLQKEVLDAMGSDGMGVPKCCAEGMVNVVKIGF